MENAQAFEGFSPAVRLGRRWFKWRSLSPLPLFLLLVLLPAQFHPEGLGLVSILAGIFSAEALRLWAVGYAGSATRTRGDRVPQLVHAGPYTHVRNPLYVANIVMYTLCGILFGNLWIAALIFLYSCAQYTFIVAFEERILLSTFGPAYEAFVAAVPRWLVSPVPRIEASDQDFDLGRALRSERSTFFSMLLMAALYFVKQRYL
jgi:protein-S-isoprenylcysteine O-methyltransferase Ste14